MTQDQIVILSPIGALACKRVSPSGVEKPPQVFRFRGYTHELADFAALAHVLTQLASQPAYFVVRGSIKAGASVENMARKHVGEEATLEECPRRWLMIDLDSWRPEISDFALDPARYAEEARAALPAVFHDAAMFWQATGSAGFKPGVRLRLAFWLDRALSSREALAWSQTWSIEVDRALYTPSQPHYTANPVFEGVPDPVQKRTGVLAGAPQVELPAVLLQGKASEAQAALEAAARSCARTDEGGRYIKLNALAFNLARKYSEIELPAEAIERVLGEVATKAGLPGHEISRAFRCAITDGRAKHETEHAGWRDLLARDKDDAPKSTQANVTLYLEHDGAFAGRLGLNERTQGIVWLRSPDWAQRDRGAVIDGADVSRVIEWFQDKAQIDAREPWVRAGLHKASAAHPYDAIQDYLGALPAWDGIERASTLFTRHLGAEPTELTRAFTVLWLAQAYRRAFASAAELVKADYMILLMGAQGLGKSGVLEHLCVPGYFQDHLPALESKDARQALGGIWILELAEFTQRKADADAFKAFTSSRADKYRPPYARDEVTVPRKCVIAITVNDDEPLQDSTGNRRFWPIVCRAKADFGAVAAERDQIWAEVRHYVQAGLAPTLPAHLEAKAADKQSEHRSEGALADTFRALADSAAPVYRGFEWEPGQLEGGRIRYLRTVQACAIAGVRADSSRIASEIKDALRAAGWSERRVKERGQWRRSWHPPDSPAKVNTVEVN